MYCEQYVLNSILAITWDMSTWSQYTSELSICIMLEQFLNQTQFDLNSQYSFDVCCKYIFCVDWRTHMGQTKVKTYFLKLKTKAKKPFSRDSRVRCSRPEVFIKIAVPSKLAKSLKNICEAVRFLIKFVNSLIDIFQGFC